MRLATLVMLIIVACKGDEKPAPAPPPAPAPVAPPDAAAAPPDAVAVPVEPTPLVPESDLQKQIEEVRKSGESVIVGGGRRGNEDVLTIGPISHGPSRDSAPDVRVSFDSAAALDDTTLSTDAVLAKIRAAYLAGLRRCYIELLKKNPGASGAANVTFTVSASGRLVAPHVVSFDGGLSKCIEDRIKAWRFPAPKDDGGAAVSATFQGKVAFKQN